MIGRLLGWPWLPLDSDPKPYDGSNVFRISIVHSILWPCSLVIFTWCNDFIAVLFILVSQWLSYGSHGMFEHSQLVGGTWSGAYAALCFSCGYFAYDQWDMLLYQLYSGWIPAILVHHLVLLICFTLALYRNVTINYLILTLICEVCISFSLQDVSYEYAAFFLFMIRVGLFMILVRFKYFCSAIDMNRYLDEEFIEFDIATKMRFKYFRSFLDLSHSSKKK